MEDIFGHSLGGPYKIRVYASIDWVNINMKNTDTYWIIGYVEINGFLATVAHTICHS